MHFGSTMLTSSGLQDIYIAKIDPSGSFLWAVKVGGIDKDNGKGIYSDHAGNSYVTGNFRGTADFRFSIGDCESRVSAPIDPSDFNSRAAALGFSRVTRADGIFPVMMSSIDGGNG